MLIREWMAKGLGLSNVAVSNISHVCMCNSYMLQNSLQGLNDYHITVYIVYLFSESFPPSLHAGKRDTSGICLTV